MKLSVNSTIAGRTSWRSRVAAAVGVGLAVVAAACAGGGSTATSPSGVSPSSLASQPANNDRNFSVSLSPASVTVGASTLTVTVNNMNVGSSQQLGSVQIVVPSGLTVTAVDTFSGSKTWKSIWTSGQTVTVGATSGTQKLGDGQSVTFQLHVTSSVCQTYTFANPAGSNETPETFSANWIYVGSTLSVAVTGCSIECPAAPAIAGDYLKNTLGMQPNDDPYKNIVAQVANAMTTEARFNGLLPCDAGYAAAVIAFVNTIVGSI